MIQFRPAAAAAAAIALALSAAPPVPARAQSTLPNIVIVLTDDLGYGDLSSYGHPTIRTPSIDRLGREGIRLTSYYAAASVCTPSRAGLLTGRYAVRSGMINAIGPGAPASLPAAEVTLAEVLRGRGYRTAIIGKWHLGDRAESNPLEHGFQSFFGLPYSNDYMPPFVKGTPPVPLYRDREVIERPVIQPSLTTRYTEEAVRFIKESSGTPFFLYLAHSMPHLPLSVSERSRGRSRAGLYGDVIEEIDWSVGEVLRTLDELRLDRNTIVIFTSDNGPWLNTPPRMLQAGVQRWDVGSAGALRDSKGSTYEGGFRVPGLVRWPERIPAGRVSADMVTGLDLFPTLARAAGASVGDERPLDGVDVMPLLAGTGAPPERDFFYFLADALHAVRRGKWKLRIDPSAQPPVVELYDLDVDPSERYNVAAGHAEVTDRLRERLEAFRTRIARDTRPATP